MAQAFARGLASGALLSDLAASLRRVGLGFALATALGLPLGALCAELGRASPLIHQPLALLRPIPPIAWIPLAILALGLGEASAVAICFLGAWMPITLHSAATLASLPPELDELGRVIGANRLQRLLLLRLPAALPGLVLGLRTGLGLSWTAVIAAELVGAQSGLGYRVQMARLGLQTEEVVAGMAAIGLCGAAMDQLMAALHRRLAPAPGGGLRMGEG